MSITQKLIEAKQRKGLTNQQIADQSGVPMGTISRIFSGASDDLKFQTLQQIAPVLGIDLNTMELSESKTIAQHPHHSCDQCPMSTRIDDLHELTKDLRHERHSLFVALLALIAFVLIFTILDSFLPGIGWFRG